MELIVLGSGTGVPSTRRGSPAFLVRVGGRCLLLDLGPGALRQLLAAGVTIDRVDYILVSHLHPDHTGDLPAYLFALKYAGLPPRTTPCRIIGRTGLAEFVSRLQAAWGRWLEPEPGQVELVEAGPGDVPLPPDEPFRVRCAEPDHTPQSLAWRIESVGLTAELGPHEGPVMSESLGEGAGPRRRCRRGASGTASAQQGRSLVYTGDTGYSPSLIELARGASLLLAECSFPEGQGVPGHLTPRLAGQMAREAEARRLVLTHLYPPADEVDVAAQAAEEFSGEIIVAEDLMRLLL